VHDSAFVVHLLCTCLCIYCAFVVHDSAFVVHLFRAKMVYTLTILNADSEKKNLCGPSV